MISESLVLESETVLIFEEKKKNSSQLSGYYSIEIRLLSKSSTVKFHPTQWVLWPGPLTITNSA